MNMRDFYIIIFGAMLTLFPACGYQLAGTGTAMVMKADIMTIVVQVNGKVRQKLSVPSGIAEDDLKAQCLEDAKVQQWMKGQPAKKVIVVPKKLVNIVV